MILEIEKDLFDVQGCTIVWGINIYYRYVFLIYGSLKQYEMSFFTFTKEETKAQKRSDLSWVTQVALDGMNPEFQTLGPVFCSRYLDVLLLTLPFPPIFLALYPCGMPKANYKMGEEER